MWRNAPSKMGARGVMPEGKVKRGTYEDPPSPDLDKTEVGR